MGLPFLPEDLLLCLVNYLQVGDCKQLRLTCKVLSNVFAPNVLKSIIIDITEVDKSDSYLDQLKLLACGHPKVPTHFIRTLNIWSLSPANNPKYFDDNGTPRFKPADKINMEERITQALKPALQALKEVHTLRWFARVHDPVSAHRVVTDVVSKYSRLIHLDINVSQFKISVFESFRNLTSIKYFATIEIPDNIVKGVGQAITQSPHLRSLDVEIQTNGGPFDIHRLFAAYPLAESQPLRLSHLALYNCRAHIDQQITLPHIGALTSLNLLTARGVWGENETLESRAQLDSFWATLEGAAVRLERIVVDRAPIGFLEYLKSYSGLKSLTLHDNRNLSEAVVGADNTLATIFFQEAIVPHCTSLEELDVLQKFDNLWCFRQEYLSTLARCSKLKVLCMGINYGQVETTASVVSSQATCGLHLLLDVIVAHAPVIRRIVFKPVAPQSSMNIGQFSEHISAIFFRRFAVQLQISIQQYCIPTSCASLPVLYVTGDINKANKRVFYIASRSSSNNQLRYQAQQED